MNDWAGFGYHVLERFIAHGFTLVIVLLALWVYGRWHDSRDR